MQTHARFAWVWIWVWVWVWVRVCHETSACDCKNITQYGTCTHWQTADQRTDTSEDMTPLPPHPCVAVCCSELGCVAVCCSVMQRVAGASEDMTPLPPHPPREPVQRFWGCAQMTRYIHYKKCLIHMFGVTFISHVWRVLRIWYKLVRCWNLSRFIA